MTQNLSDSTKAANFALDELRRAHESEWENRQYTKSIVAIIDIMGVKEWFCVSDFDKQKKVFKSWDYTIKSTRLMEVQQDLQEKYGEFPLKYSILSDSIIVSVDITVPGAFSKLFMYLRLFIIQMFAEINPPFMTRGAIVIGDIYHEDNIVFGPALIKAHKMEKTEAVNFRHIIDRVDYDMLYDCDKNNKIIFDGTFYLCDDGYYCFDYLKSYLGYIDNRIVSYPSSNVSTSGLNTLNNIKSKIKNEIENNEDDYVVSKYLWMQDYYKKTLQWAIYRTDKDDYVWLKKAFAEAKRN